MGLVKNSERLELAKNQEKSNKIANFEDKVPVRGGRRGSNPQPRAPQARALTN